MRFNSVVFPDPLGPIRPRNSPLGTSRVRSLRTSTRSLPRRKYLWTPRMRTIIPFSSNMGSRLGRFRLLGFYKIGALTHGRSWTARFPVFNCPARLDASPIFVANAAVRQRLLEFLHAFVGDVRVIKV